MAEKETLPEVEENKEFVNYLNKQDGVTAKLIAPEELKLEDDKLVVDGKEITSMFMDFNVNLLVNKLAPQHSIEPIKEAIRRGVLVNPRSLAPTGVKSAFEYVNLNPDRFSPSTVAYTPWTRLFNNRETSGPNGEEIVDLAGYTLQNKDNLVLKPVKGYSGKGIHIGSTLSDKEWREGIVAALKVAKSSDPYIVQAAVPLNMWTEEMPIIVMDDQKQPQKLELWARQTDFRCFISNRGLDGFLLRFGGRPTNVGSGGGIQAGAVLESNMSVGEATEKINHAYMDLSFDQVMEIK